MFLESQLPILPGPGNRAGADTTIEVCRSYSYRLNLTNYGRSYEHVDFFASRKIACARSAAAWVSQEIYEECVSEVREAVKDWLEAFNRKRQQEADADNRRTTMVRPIGSYQS